MLHLVSRMLIRLIRKYFDDLPTRIRNSALSEDLRQRALLRFNETKDESLKDISEGLRVKKDFLSEAKKLLAFMKDRQGHYKYQDNKIIFYAQEDGEAFGAYQHNLLSLLKEEERMAETVQQEGLIWSKELANLTK